MSRPTQGLAIRRRIDGEPVHLQLQPDPRRLQQCFLCDPQFKQSTLHVLVRTSG